MEKTTMKELDDEMTSLKASVKTDMDNCIQLKNELTQLSDALKEIVDKSKAELLFVASKKCLEKIKHSETYLKENSVQIKSSLTFQANRDIQQYLSKLSGLGRILVCTQAVPLHDDPDQIFTVQGGSLKSLLTASFSEEIFYISAVCVLTNDQILVADRAEKKVNLLNHQYQVVGHCNVNGYPFDICQITPSEVAVAVDKDKTNEVQFISVNDGLLSNGTTFQLEHKCIGIAYNLQDMYLSSGTALYKYSMQGDMLEKLYEDTSALKTVNKCAVSPSGDKIFVTNYYHDKVLTLATDGTVLHTFTDPDLKRPRGIHVTAQGQVLVCGYASNTILQLDGEGNKKLATLATKRDGLDDPLSVYFNRSTATIIVGQFSNNILVFKVK
ncbi:uncharacterized protein LOC127869044 [Dreissena polymorpha]|uniref:uncharacterized protein LOC127869044 n=1 Tax=Dreissena polymorpha TaxID=45954 RepID=UPI002263E830|nr:uncharacterized protein LOC127869044 [Dreissena polymorpha]